MPQKIRVMLVDDHAIVRKGIAALLATEPDFEVVGEASDGAEAIAKAQALRPDVVLMDLVMPKMDGIEATRQITSQLKGVRVLVLTSFAADDKVFPAIKAGALGLPAEGLRPDRAGPGDPPGPPRAAVARAVDRPQGAVRAGTSLEGPTDDGSADRPRDGGAAPRGPGAEQSRNRRAAGHHRADRAHARQQHPGQAAPGEPHPGGVVRAPRRPRLAGRHSVLWRRRPNHLAYQKSGTPPT